MAGWRSSGLARPRRGMPGTPRLYTGGFVATLRTIAHQDGLALLWRHQALLRRPLHQVRRRRAYPGAARARGHRRGHALAHDEDLVWEEKHHVAL